MKRSAAGSRGGRSGPRSCGPRSPRSSGAADGLGGRRSTGQALLELLATRSNWWTSIFGRLSISSPRSTGRSPARRCGRGRRPRSAGAGGGRRRRRTCPDVRPTVEPSTVIRPLPLSSSSMPVKSPLWPTAATMRSHSMSISVPGPRLHLAVDPLGLDAPAAPWRGRRRPADPDRRQRGRGSARPRAARARSPACRRHLLDRRADRRWSPRRPAAGEVGDVALGAADHRASRVGGLRRARRGRAGAPPRRRPWRCRRRRPRAPASRRRAAVRR